MVRRLSAVQGEGKSESRAGCSLTKVMYHASEAGVCKPDDILKRDADGTLLHAAYDAVDWQAYYDRLRGTPFYDWATEEGGVLAFAGPRHVENGCFFSRIEDISTVEGDWLRQMHPMKPSKANLDRKE